VLRRGDGHLLSGASGDRSGRSGLRVAVGPAWVIVCLLAALTTGCVPVEENEMPEPQRPIEEVQAEYGPRWMELPGVVGHGLALCQDAPCIRVFLSEGTLEARDSIPEEVEGYPVEVVVTGAFEPR